MLKQSQYAFINFWFNYWLYFWCFAFLGNQLLFNKVNKVSWIFFNRNDANITVFDFLVLPIKTLGHKKCMHKERNELQFLNFCSINLLLWGLLYSLFYCPTPICIAAGYVTEQSSRVTKLSILVIRFVWIVLWCENSCF